MDNSNPFQYLYEFDLQSDLLMRLRNHITEKVQIAPGLKFFDAPGIEDLSINLVNSEYSGGFTNGGPIDITGIYPDVSVLESFVDWTLKSGRVLNRKLSINNIIYNFPLCVGIELKYRQIGSQTSVSDSIKDLLKCENYRKDPYHKVWKELAEGDDFNRWAKILSERFKSIALCFLQLQSDYEQEYQKINALGNFRAIFEASHEIMDRELVQSLEGLSQCIILISSGKVSIWESGNSSDLILRV